jgi:hypothetical protein
MLICKAEERRKERMTGVSHCCNSAEDRAMLHEGKGVEKKSEPFSIILAMRCA